MPAPQMILHTSNRLEVLAERLADDLAEDPPPPLEREVVVVQSRGMYRWLTFELARRLGIAASLSAPFPATLCHHLAEHLLDGEGRPACEDLGRKPPSPFSRGILTWRIHARFGDPELVDDRRWQDGPAAYLTDDPDQRKRYQLAARVAGLFDDYLLFRPQMMVDWESADGEGVAASSWQAMLWRRLVADADEDHLGRRCLRLIDHLRRARQRPPGLPRRLSVFGVSTLPPIFLRLVTELSRWLPVKIYFVSPTHHYWGDLRPRRLFLDGASLPRPEEELHLEEGHPLLAALGRQGRDFFNLLQAADEDGAAWHELDFVEPGTDTLLHRLQTDVLHLADRGGDAGLAPHPIDPADESLRVHVCHSPRREMEVLRDQILDALVHHPDLHPGDVLVLVPDVDLYAPYIRAVFGVEQEGRPRLPFTIADRGAGEEQPPAATVLQVLRLVAGRLVPGDVLDLLEVAAIRRAAGIAAGEIPQLRRWIDDTRIRWGMDGAQRGEDFGVPPEEANTWRAGLDRLLMGYAAGDRDELVAGVLPFAGATAARAELLGRLAEFVATLFDRLRGLRRPRPLDAWARDLRRTVDVLYRAGDEDEERGLLWLRQVFEQLKIAHRAIAGRPRGSGPPEVTLEAIRAHLESRVAGAGTGFGFLGGGITFAALEPMRALPFEVVCVAGLEDGAFPRRDPPRSFDLRTAEPRLGDRRQRDDDRYLFLETLLAARRRLILTYVGRSQRDSREQPPSVVVSELLDALDRGFASADGRPPRRHLVVEHRLQPWSPAYFGSRDRLGVRPRLWSYSHEDYEGAVALGDGPRPEAPFVTSGTTVTGALEIDLGDLAELWVSPSRGYCRQVLKLYLDRFPARSEDTEPFTVDALATYRLQNRLLRRRLRAAGDGGPERREDSELELLRAAGELPLASLGAAAYARLDRKLRELVARLPRHRPLPPRAVELAGCGWNLSGRIDDLTDIGLLRFRPAKVKSSDLIRAWIVHVVWNAWVRQQPAGVRAEPVETVVVGTGTVVRLTALDEPRRLLESLVDGYRKGLGRPLTLFERASFLYADQRRRLADPKSRLRKTPLERAGEGWRGTDYRRGDSRDPYVALCFRGREPLASESFGTWADYLWGPLFEALEEESR